MSGGRKLIDLAGRVVGDLTVLRREGRSGMDPTWVCACAKCGGRHLARGYNLRKGLGACVGSRVPATTYTHDGETLTLRSWSRRLHRGMKELAERVATLPLAEALTPAPPTRGACGYCSRQSHFRDVDGDFVCRPGVGCAKGLAA